MKSVINQSFVVELLCYFSLGLRVVHTLSPAWLHSLSFLSQILYLESCAPHQDWNGIFRLGFTNLNQSFS